MLALVVFDLVFQYQAKRLAGKYVSEMTYFVLGGTLKLNQSAYLMSVRWHISKTTRPNFTKFSVHVTCGRDSDILWGSVKHYILPVLWMTSCFHVMYSEWARIKDGAYFRSIRQEAAPERSLPSPTSSRRCWWWYLSSCVQTDVTVWWLSCGRSHCAGPFTSYGERRRLCNRQAPFAL